MAIVVKPKSEARITRGKSPVAEQDYVIRRTDDRNSAITQQEAEEALLLGTPDVAAALLRNQISVTQTAAPSVWNGHVIWRVDPIPSENAPLRWNGTTRGGSARIFRSLKTRGVWTRPDTYDGGGNPLTYRDARDLNGAISVDEDNNVQGTDVVSPNEEWTLQVFVPADLFTSTYRRRLRQYSPSVNSKKWKDFAPGEVLFVGADWDFSIEGGKVDPSEQAPKRLVQITYYFRAGFNETLTIGDLGAKDEIGDDIPIVKAAHDHIWYEWEEETDERTKEIIRRPTVARIEQIYNELPFAALGLGGEWIDA